MDDRAFLGYNKKKRKTTMSSKSGVVVDSKTESTRGAVWKRKDGTYWGRATHGNFTLEFNNLHTEREALSHLRAAERKIRQFYDEQTI